VKINSKHVLLRSGIWLSEISSCVEKLLLKGKVQKQKQILIKKELFCNMPGAMASWYPGYI
jgi:hypothetical protein